MTSSRNVSTSTTCSRSLADLFAPLFQPSRVTPPMKDRQNPNLFMLDDVVNAVELEAMQMHAARRQIGLDAAMLSR